MATYTINKIEYDGNVYNLQDENVGIYSTYDESNYVVTLVAGSLGDADSTEY